MKEPGDTSRLDSQRAYWDSNLDTRNLSQAASLAADGASVRPSGTSAAPDAPHPNLDEEIAFLSSPEYQYARKQLGDISSGLLVLDIGCGMGVNALAMARDGARVVAFDLSLERLRALMRWARAEGLAGLIFPVQGAIERAPLRNGALDRAFTKSVLIHTRIDEAGREIARILKAGGLGGRSGRCGPDGRPAQGGPNEDATNRAGKDSEEGPCGSEGCGIGVFIEPSRFNPFAAVYRRFFGPRIWRDIAFYFDDARWRRFARPFASFERRPFFFLAFAAFYWQFGRRDLSRFGRSLRFWSRLDAVLFRMAPFLKRLRWMDVVTVYAPAAGAAPGEGDRPRN